jgi:hypothetical protein
MASTGGSLSSQEAGQLSDEELGIVCRLFRNGQDVLSRFRI